jgi:hypothetical protein
VGGGFASWGCDSQRRAAFFVWHPRGGCPGRAGWLFQREGVKGALPAVGGLGPLLPRPLCCLQARPAARRACRASWA